MNHEKNYSNHTISIELLWQLSIFIIKKKKEKKKNLLWQQISESLAAEFLLQIIDTCCL
jgi:hypothetical protein